MSYGPAHQMVVYRTLLGPALLLLGCSSSGSSGPPSYGTHTVAHDSGTPGSSGAGSSGTDAGGSSAASCAGSPVEWKDDGVQHCASSAEAIVKTNTTRAVDGGPDTRTSLELVIVQPQTTYIFSIAVTAQVPFGGTYGCTATPTSVVEVSYDDVGVYSTSVTSCTVTVALSPSDGGMVASGTFSVMLMVLEGGTKVLSDGTFSLPVTPG